MTRKAPTPCTRCGQPATNNGKCHTHNRQADTQRGTSTQRGYNTAGHQSFRRAVLDRDGWTCPCGNPATVADHHPLSRRDLIAKGSDPDDPRYGRALCKRCHDQHTGSTQGYGALRHN